MGLTREKAKEKIWISTKETYPYSIEDNVEDIIDQIFNGHEAQLKAERKKARSIVAMLFWEWKKSIRESGYNTFYNDEFDDGSYWFVNAKEQSFKQAYKMLKDIKCY